MKRILLICGALLLTILLLEFAVRAFGTTNANGQFWFRGYTLPPYTLPLSELQAKIDNYLVKRDQATLIPDPATGWTYKPNSTRENGGFMINSAGLRSTRDFTLQPASDTLRIALFGDSFVAGDEVKDDEVWGYNLERLLIQAGTRAEVLNFGVGGYGMGQAFLRWKHQGKDYAPDVVIFVFQAENLDRNANVFRLLYQGGVVYSKPRFILEEDSLALINSPALPPEEIMDVLEGFDSHPLAAHEAFYRGRELSSPIWEISKLAGLLHAALERFFSLFRHLKFMVPPANGANSERRSLQHSRLMLPQVAQNSYYCICRERIISKSFMRVSKYRIDIF